MQGVLAPIILPPHSSCIQWLEIMPLTVEVECAVGILRISSPSASTHCSCILWFFLLRGEAVGKGRGGGGTQSGKGY